MVFGKGREGIGLYSMMDENGMDVPKTFLPSFHMDFLIDKRHVQWQFVVPEESLPSCFMQGL
jgi:hypothetical protein